MSTAEIIPINIYKITENGMVISAIRREMDVNFNAIISSQFFVPENVNTTIWKDKLYLNCDRLIEEIRNRRTRMYISKGIEKTLVNLPVMIRCQNCDMNFPTKYQYQRHQCEFNAEKVVLKPDADPDDAENRLQIKYVCQICNKQFVSKNNLERHQSSHEHMQENICEHCNKQFVSENRLKTHKENHCKKAGDISKFYRSDVTVWKCKRCHEVFSSHFTVSHHISNCTENIPGNNKDLMNFTGGKLECAIEKQSTFTEKMLTEILLQCEFCNRTYADKHLLIMHQRKHTTEKNYECVNCSKVFESYAIAAHHWLKRCTEYVNLFYLPKLTYCEYCDRTFKSHELLYTHKIKKKHYTSKLHVPSKENMESDVNSNRKSSADNKEVLNMLIEDVLKTLDVPVNKMNSALQINNDDNKENIDPNSSQNENVKNDTNIENAQTNDAAEKKRRGRKRKWPKNDGVSVKTLCVVDSGFKYQCERCINVFATIPELESHREKEHASSFTCEECRAVLHSAKALLIHSRAHQSLKPYVCETCGRSYSQTSHLWQHMRFHQGIKPFACPHEGCEARYTIRPDLKDHIRKVHTRERPFKCNVCDKCFLTGSVYYQHRLIHTNDRRYACDLCPKRFFRADALNNHRRIHTDERPYPCHMCGREFRQKGDRNKHMRTQHQALNFA